MVQVQVLGAREELIDSGLDRSRGPRSRPVRREQEQRQDEDQVPERGERTDQPLVRPRRRIDRHDRVEAEHGLAGIGIGDDEARDEDEAHQPADIAGCPADARQSAEALVGDERGHHGVVEHGGELSADGRERKRQKHERRHAGLPRNGEPQPAKPHDQQHREACDPRLARESGIGDRAEDRREKRCNQLGAAGGIGPQRGAKRGVSNKAVHEIGAEQEGDDERVERLRRPVEQHPAGQSERTGAFGRLAPDAALPLTRTSGHRARSDGWAARSGRRGQEESARRESCRKSRSR